MCFGGWLGGPSLRCRPPFAAARRRSPALSLNLSMIMATVKVFQQDSVSEWLRRWIRNPLGSARRGSNPLAVVLVPFRERLRQRLPKAFQRFTEGSRRLPEAPRGSQRLPEGPRGSQRFPEAPHDSQRLREAHREAPRGSPRGSQRLLAKAPKGRQRLLEKQAIGGSRNIGFGTTSKTDGMDYE
jgi:hypothetical protein